MDFKDYYAILGVPKDATADVIKKAFRKLARRYHPEKGVPSLCTNRPSALELIMSMSEQVVRSFGLREPTSR